MSKQFEELSWRSRHSFEPSVGKATRSWESRSRVNAQLLFHDLRSFIRECQCSDRLLRKFRGDDIQLLTDSSSLNM